jgi:hypothetical protein
VTFAKRVFLIAGIYGFIGIAVAWQIVFLMISREPIRYRPIMLAAIVEKASFGLPAIVLYAAGKLSAQMLGAGILDLIFGALFIVAYARTATAAIVSRP